MTGEPRRSVLMQQGSVAASAAGSVSRTRDREKRRRPLRLRAQPGHLTRPQPVYEKGRLRIDFDAYEVFLDGQRVQLFLREFELLCFFVRSPNRVFDRAQILNLVWGRDASIDPRTIDVHVRRLRTRIERDDAHPELVVTVRGVGYKFDDRALTPSESRTLQSGRGGNGAQVPTTASTANPAPSSAATTSSIRRTPR